MLLLLMILINFALLRFGIVLLQCGHFLAGSSISCKYRRALCNGVVDRDSILQEIRFLFSIVNDSRRGTN